MTSSGNHDMRVACMHRSKLNSEHCTTRPFAPAGALHRRPQGPAWRLGGTNEARPNPDLARTLSSSRHDRPSEAHRNERCRSGAVLVASRARGHASCPDRSCSRRIQISRPSCRSLCGVLCLCTYLHCIGFGPMQRARRHVKLDDMNERPRNEKQILHTI